GTEQLNSSRRETDEDESTVFCRARPKDQPPGLQAIEKSREIRLRADHPGAGLMAGNPRLAGSSNNAKSIVLCRRYPMGLESFLQRLFEHRRRSLDVERDLFFEGGPCFRLLDFASKLSGHIGILAVITVIVKRDIGWPDRTQVG